MLFSKSPASGLLVSLLLFQTGLLQANEPIISVTATRLPQTVDESLSSVTVIVREDIEKKQPRDVVELLRNQAGLDIARSGGPGSNTSVFMRSGNSDHVLVLIDGVRVSSATTGSFSWTHLPVDQIERVEIVRGSRTAQYGSDAISGVIQIFTRKSSKPAASVTAGSYGHRGMHVRTGGEDQELSVSIAAGHVANEGFSAKNMNASGYNPDKDGYTNNNFNLHLTKQLSSTDHVVALSYLWIDGDVDFDEGNVDSVNQAASLTLQGDFSDDWNHKLLIGWSSDRLKTQDASIFSPDTDIETRRWMFDWQNDVFLTDTAVITFGLSRVVDDVSSFDLDANSMVFSDSIINHAGYLQLQFEVDDLDALLAIRHDDHENFGGKTTGQLSVGYQVSDKLRLIASHGTAFKAPDLNELFSPGFGGLFAGNSSLRPENSSTTEFSLRYEVNENQHVSVSYFETDTDDLINASSVFPFQLTNVDEVETEGIELIYLGSHKSWDWSFNASYNKAIDKLTALKLVRRPQKKLAFDISYEFPDAHKLGAEIFISGDRQDFDSLTFARIKNAGYSLVNLFGTYKLNNQLSLSGRIENLLGEQYEVVPGYNTADSSVFLTLKYQ